MTTVAVAGSTFTFNIALYQQANTKLLVTPPTLAAVDFTKSVNGGALGALDNTPTVTPALGCQVQIVLSAAETTAAAAGGRIAIYWQDSVGTEWCSGMALVAVHAAEVAEEGDAMTLTAAYNAAMTAAQAGDAMILTAAGIAAVWNATTRTLTTPIATMAGSTNTDIVLYKYSNNSIVLTGITFDAARTNLYLTIKSSNDDDDPAARVQIKEVGGLTYLNGAATTAAWGSLTVVGTQVTVFLADHAAGALEPGHYTWDLKQVLAAGAAVPLVSGSCTVYRVATWAVV